MRKTARFITTVSVLATMLGTLSLTPQMAAAADAKVIEEGKKTCV
jgi:hypothetical protein